MEDFGDSTNRFIILFCFIFYYLYLRYRQTQLKLTKGFNKINCNPLQMMIGSMVNEEAANNSFAQCMEYTTAEKTRKAIDDAKEKYETNVNDIVKDISNNVDDGNNDSLEQQEKLFELVNTKTNDVNDLVVQQQKMNKVIENTSGPIKDMFTNIQGVTSQLQSTIGSFLDNYQQLS